MNKLVSFWSIVIMLIGLAVFEGNAQVPEDMDFDHIKVNPFDLPEVFDLRNSSQLSPVKTQGTGGCWSSSVMAAVEPWMRKEGLGNYWFSDRNLQITNGFDNSRNTYGNHYMATAYLSRGSGPVYKSNSVDSIAFLRPEIPYILGDARYLPGDPTLIKQTLIDFGPVYTMLYFKRKQVDSLTYVLDEPDNPLSMINHAVALVGWNDTIKTANEPGAWIAQNSLGEKFGDSGFFYIPYDNPDVLKHNAVWISWTPFREENKILYYDTLGSFNSYGFNDSICFGLTKFNMGDNSTITGFSSHINSPGTVLHFEVYTSFDEKEKQLSGKVGSTDPRTCVFPGYYTINLHSSIDLPADSEFYVLAKYNSPDDTQPLPIENVIKDYSNPHITSGKCWVNPNAETWPDAWYPCGMDTPYPVLDFDLCIRVIVDGENK